MYTGITMKYNVPKKTDECSLKKMTVKFLFTFAASRSPPRLSYNPLIDPKRKPQSERNSFSMSANAASPTPINASWVSVADVCR